MPAGALEMFLDLLRSAHGPKLLRLKGIVRLAEDQDRPIVVQGVQDVFYPPERLDRWPGRDRRTRLVRRVRFTIDGLASASGTLLELDTRDFQNTHGIE